MIESEVEAAIIEAIIGSLGTWEKWVRNGDSEVGEERLNVVFISPDFPGLSHNQDDGDEAANIEEEEVMRLTFPFSANKEAEEVMRLTFHT